MAVVYWRKQLGPRIELLDPYPQEQLASVNNTNVIKENWCKDGMCNSMSTGAKFPLPIWCTS